MLNDETIRTRVSQFNQEFAEASKQVEKEWESKPVLHFIAATISYPATFRSPQELARPKKFWPAVCEIALLILAGIAIPEIRRLVSRRSSVDG
jgi:hypothetical protein